MRRFRTYPLIGGKRGGIPDGWVEVEWLESKPYRDSNNQWAGQYIDSGWCCDYAKDFNIDIGFAVSALNVRYALLSSYSTPYNVSCELYNNNTVRFWAYNGVRNINSSAFSDTEFHSAHFSSVGGMLSVSVDDNNPTQNEFLADAKTTESAYLFVDRMRRFSTFYSSLKISYCDIRENGKPVRAMRPVRNATTNEGAMCDVLTGDIYRNAGTGAFVVGPDTGLPYDYEVEWLQSDGVAYVDTGIELYSPTNDLSRVEFDMTAELCIDPSKLSSSTVPRCISLVGITNDRNYGIGCSNQGDSFCATVYGNYSRYSTGYVVSADSTTLHELRMKIEAGICDFYYDGTLVKNASVPSSPYNLSPGIPFLVFARSYPSGGSIARIVNGMNRARRFKITSNGKTFEGIAVSKDGVGYFYDRVSGQLFGNSASSGALLVGPRVG